MCGFCSGATIGEARAFYEAVRKGTVSVPMLQKMVDHPTRLSLPARQLAELQEDPDLFKGQPAFKAAVEELLSWWITRTAPVGSEEHLENLFLFEQYLVQLRETYDEVFVGAAFDALLAAAPKSSQQVLAQFPELADHH